jgi:hypothetical protein
MIPPDQRESFKIRKASNAPIGPNIIKLLFETTLKDIDKSKIVNRRHIRGPLTPNQSSGYLSRTKS